VNLKEWCIMNGIKSLSNKDLVNDPAVRKMFQEKIDEKNKHFGQWETIKRFELMPDEWTIDGGELTPTLKVKRKIVTEKYQALIDKLYS